jgi:hypothetical protein
MGIKHFLISGLFLVSLVLLSGCVSQPGPSGQNQTQVPEYVQMCLNSCNNTRNAGDFAALELGVCLLDRIPIEPDWVCDVAHSPRQPVDDNPNNQCQSYLKGETKHFVEVSPECKLIRAV